MFKTKLRATFVAGLFGVFALSGAAAAEPYAPMAEDPGKPTIEGQEDGYPLEQMVLQAAPKNMPDRSAVKQPPYPGAVAVNTQPASEGSTNGVAYTQLPSVILHTTDNVATVMAFYQEALPDWTKLDLYGMEYLYEGSGEFNPMEDSAREMPYVMVGGLRDFMKYHAVPDAKTSITIFYK
jgi:hypothetical protein